MHFGVPLEDDRLLALMRPDERVRTVLTADVYGEGAADTLLGRALDRPRPRRLLADRRRRPRLLQRRARGRQGLPALHRPARCAGPASTRAYLRDATERSLQRIGADAFDLLLLHNPDRTGYTHEAVWEGMVALRDAGLTRRIGVAPGPANGFTLDVIDCFERYGDVIDWAMLILNPFEPWPGELALPGGASPRRQGPHARRRLRRPLPRRPAPRPADGRARPPQVPPGRLDRARHRAPRRAAADRRSATA